MTHTPFTTWLVAQEGRADDVGELAAHYLSDVDAPPAWTVADVGLRMLAVGATDSYYAALAQAAGEYHTAKRGNLLGLH